MVHYITYVKSNIANAIYALCEFYHRPPSEIGMLSELEIEFTLKMMAKAAKEQAKSIGRRHA